MEKVTHHLIPLRFDRIVAFRHGAPSFATSYFQTSYHFTLAHNPFEVMFALSTSSATLCPVKLNARLTSAKPRASFQIVAVSLNPRVVRQSPNQLFRPLTPPSSVASSPRPFFRQMDPFALFYSESSHHPSSRGAHVALTRGIL